MCVVYEFRTGGGVDVYVRTPSGYYGVNVSVNSPSLGARRLSHGETHAVVVCGGRWSNAGCACACK